MQKQDAASPADDCERGAEQMDGVDGTTFAYGRWREAYTVANPVCPRSL